MEFRDLAANPKRDLCEERVRVYNEATTPAKVRYVNTKEVLLEANRGVDIFMAK